MSWKHLSSPGSSDESLDGSPARDLRRAGNLKRRTSYMALPGPMSCSKKSDVFESAEHDTFLFTTYIKPRAKIRPPIWTMDFSTSTQCNRRWRDSREQSLWRHTQIHLTNGTLVAHDVRQDASFDVQLCVKMMEELRQRQMMCRDASRFCQMATVHLPTQNLLS